MSNDEKKSLLGAGQHFIISIPTDAVGLAIGKLGRNFKKIEEETGAKPFLQSFEDTNSALHERMLILTGTEEAVISAMRSFLPAFVERKTNTFNKEETKDPNNEITKKWLIAENLCSILIGKGGRVIQEINSVSGAIVKIAHPEEGQKDSGER
jgi:transcription antitermination factor NusA-like protein